MIRLEKFFDNLFSNRRWVIHTLFWLVVLILYVVFFGRQNKNYLQTFFFVGLLMPLTIGTTYFFNYFLVPRYLMKERYGFFLVYGVYAIIISVFLEVVIMIITFILIAEFQIRNMSAASIDFFFLFTSLVMVVILGVAIKLLLHWKQSKEDYQKLMLEKAEAELRFLKVQINPHFLFNTLNNLYYLTTEKSDKAPAAILQLSAMLDYVLRSSKLVMVPLDEELKQIENYMGLELLRYEDRVQIERITEGCTDGWNIGPMMLITLIENAFKHGVMNASGKSWIQLIVHADSNKAEISIGNSRKNHSGGTGIGLSNLRSQLDLLYGQNYNFRIESDIPDKFVVILTIKK